MFSLRVFLGVFLSWIYSTLVFRLLPDYITSIYPIFLVIYVYSSKFGKSKSPKKSSVLIIAALSLLILFLPYGSAYAGYSTLLNSGSSTGGPAQRVVFISHAAMVVTGNGYYVQGLVRANIENNQDFSKFLICGAGACGETSMFEQACFQRLGIETMMVEFPGEDHAFIEVKLNSTWEVVDPGYSMILVSICERAAARVAEVGTIS